MGETPQYSSLDNFPGSSSYSVVAPFAADIDTSRVGSVKYTQFTTSDSQMNRVSGFIRSKTGNSFSATRMMVAEWRGVPEYQRSIVSCTMFLHVWQWATWCMHGMEGEDVQYYHNNLLSLFGY